MVCYHYQVNKTRLKNPQFCSICILRLNVINIYIYIYNIFRRYLLLCGVGACYCICIRTFLNVVFWRFPEIYWQHFHTEGRKQFCVSWPILSDQYMKTKLFNLSPLWLQDFFLIFSHSLSSVQIGPSCKKPGPDWPQLHKTRSRLLKTYYAFYSLFICTLVCAGELLKLLHNFVCKFPTINWSLYTTVDHAKTLFFCIKLSNFL